MYICIFCIYSTMCFFSKKRSPGSNALSSCCHSLPRLVRLAKSNMAHFNYKLAMADWTYHFYAGCSLKKTRNAGGLKALDDLLYVRSTCSQGMCRCEFTTRVSAAIFVAQKWLGRNKPKMVLGGSS